jgi:hypothetical protein
VRKIGREGFNKEEERNGLLSIVLGERVKDGDLAPFRALIHGLG